MLRKLLAGLGLGAVAALIVLAVAGTSDLLDRQELTTYDWRMRLAADPAATDKNIVLVEINDLSIREMSGVFGRWPWPRLAVSFAVDFLKRGPAKVVAVDLSLPEPDRVETYVWDDPNDKWSGRQSDRALADSAKKAGNVVMLADAVYEGIEGGGKDVNASTWPGSAYHAGPLAESRPMVLAPYQALADSAAALGHNFLTPDDDSTARRSRPTYGTQVVEFRLAHADGPVGHSNDRAQR